MANRNWLRPIRQSAGHRRTWTYRHTYRCAWQSAGHARVGVECESYGTKSSRSESNLRGPRRFAPPERHRHAALAAFRADEPHHYGSAYFPDEGDRVFREYGPGPAS